MGCNSLNSQFQGDSSYHLGVCSMVYLGISSDRWHPLTISLWYPNISFQFSNIQPQASYLIHIPAYPMMSFHIHLTCPARGTPATAVRIGLTLCARLGDPSGRMHAPFWPHETTFVSASPPLQQLPVLSQTQPAYHTWWDDAMDLRIRGLRELVGLRACLACNLDTELACNLDKKVLMLLNVGGKTKRSFFLYISLHLWVSPERINNAYNRLQ